MKVVVEAVEVVEVDGRGCAGRRRGHGGGGDG